MLAAGSKTGAYDVEAPDQWRIALCATWRLLFVWTGLERSRIPIRGFEYFANEFGGGHLPPATRPPECRIDRECYPRRGVGAAGHQQPLPFQLAIDDVREGLYLAIYFFVRSHFPVPPQSSHGLLFELPQQHTPSASPHMSHSSPVPLHRKHRLLPAGRGFSPDPSGASGFSESFTGLFLFRSIWHGSCLFYPTGICSPFIVTIWICHVMSTSSFSFQFKGVCIGWEFQFAVGFTTATAPSEEG